MTNHAAAVPTCVITNWDVIASPLADLHIKGMMTGNLGSDPARLRWKRGFPWCGRRPPRSIHPSIHRLPSVDSLEEDRTAIANPVCTDRGLVRRHLAYALGSVGPHMGRPFSNLPSADHSIPWFFEVPSADSCQSRQRPECLPSNSVF